MRFEGRKALVTGGGSGIGAAIVERLAAEGASVLVADIDDEGARRVAADVGADAVHLDVTDPESAKAAMAAAGTLDVLVNNAGTDEFGFFTDTDPDLWARLIAVNLVGVLACTHAALPAMQAAGYGRIVNIASEAGRVGSKGSAVYSAAKGGVIAFTKVIARENGALRRHGQCDCPGTDRHPSAAQRRGARRGRRADHRQHDRRNSAPAPRLAKRGGSCGRVPRRRGELLRHRRDARRLRRHGDGLSVVGPADDLDLPNPERSEGEPKPLELGASRTDEFTVEGPLLTDVGGTIGMSVLSTPGMIAMMERTSAVLAYERLPEGSATVGFEVCIKHVSGAGEGATCTASATLTKVVDDRKLFFDVEVREGERTIGVGTHQRRVIQVPDAPAEGT